MEYGRILIVDDSATSRLIIRRCFEIAGCSGSVFHEAEDGVEALAFLAVNTVDLILCDVKMPKMDGWTLMKKIKFDEKTRHIPVILISSVAEISASEQSIRNLTLAVIQKPVSPAKAAQALGR